MKKRVLRIVIGILTVICGLTALISAFFHPLLTLYVANKTNINIKNPGSVGIIGGSDGPTAIFVTNQNHSFWFTFLFTLLTILGVIYLIIEKQKRA